MIRLICVASGSAAIATCVAYPEFTNHAALVILASLLAVYLIKKGIDKL